MTVHYRVKLAKDDEHTTIAHNMREIDVRGRHSVKDYDRRVDTLTFPSTNEVIVWLKPVKPGTPEKVAA